jgi:hypothetical protein
MGLPATRGPDCAKLYIGPGKNSDEDESDCCTGDGGCWASPKTKAKTEVKEHAIQKKKHTNYPATKQFSLR